jgi:hypothetical protein
MNPQNDRRTPEYWGWFAFAICTGLLFGSETMSLPRQGWLLALPTVMAWLVGRLFQEAHHVYAKSFAMEVYRAFATALSEDARAKT